jgi:hypothetical protein
VTSRQRIGAADLAAAVRSRPIGHPKIERTLRQVADGLVDEMRDAFPDIGDAQLGAILLHAASCGAGLIERLHAGGVAAQTIAASTANVIALAGEKLHTAAHCDMTREPRQT